MYNENQILSILKQLVIFIIIGFTSCNTGSIVGSDCLTPDNLNQLVNAIDTNSMNSYASHIYFRSKGGWGGWEEHIVLNTRSGQIEHKSIRGRGKEMDTTITYNIINASEIENILIVVEKLTCQPYILETSYYCADCDRYEIFTKKNNLLQGWTWDGTNTSLNMREEYIWGNRHILNEHKHLAVKTEGLLYKAAGWESTDLVYFIDGKCQENEVDIYISPSLQNHLTYKVLAEHPRYNFETYNSPDNNFPHTTIPCNNTSIFARDLNLINITKMGDTIKAETIYKQQ